MSLMMQNINSLYILHIFLLRTLANPANNFRIAPQHSEIAVQ